jgi:uncharacterized protein (TIRG00374 family)
MCPVNKKQIIQLVLKASISALLIAWIIQGVDLDEIFDRIGSADLLVLLFAFIFKLAGIYISAVRWRILLRAQGADATIPFLTSSYFVGFFFNNMLPSSIGGDVVRIYDSWRSGTNRPTAVTVIFVDRFLGSLALIFMVFGTLLIPTQLTDAMPLSRVGLFLGAIAMIAFCWLIFVTPRTVATLLGRFRFPIINKVAATLHKVADAFEIFQKNRSALLNSLWLSVLLQINVVIYHYIVAIALGLDLPFYSFFFTIPAYTLITTLPISINGIGIRENLFIFFFGLFGLANTEAVAYSWLLYGILLIQGLLGGIVYALRRERRVKINNPPMQQPLETESDA